MSTAVPRPVARHAWRIATARAGVALLLWALAGVLGGCIKVDESMSLRPDGSGTLDVVYGMPEQMVAQMQAVQALSKQLKEGDDAADPRADAQRRADGEAEIGLEFDPQELRRAFRHYQAQGVHLVSAETELRKGWRFTHLKVRFDSLRGLLDTELFKDRNLSVVRLPDGSYRLGLSDSRGRQRPPPEAKAAEHEPATAEMLKGFHVATALNVPGRIIDTNAHRHSATRAEWVYDIAQDSNALTRMGEERPYVVFEGKGVNLPEIQADRGGEASTRP